MAKKQTKDESDSSRRQSRKEILRARKHEQQQRNIRIAAIIVGLVILLVLGVAVVNELLIAPNRPVATVEGQVISLTEWQDRVEFERAQRIISLEEQLANFNGDIGLVQQFSSQSIIELISENSEAFGEAILDRMVDEEIIRQGAEERGLTPLEGEIDERIGSLFNYYGGESPTPLPEPTETIIPTPSLTPIGFEGEDEETAAEAPTSAPLPSPTPVSSEAFQQEFDELINQYSQLGVNEETYRTVITHAMMAERMMDALAEEQGLPEQDDHVSFFYILATDEEETNEIQDEIASGEFVTIWNTIRSRDPDPEAEQAPTASASEILWQTQDWLEGSFGTEIAQVAFDIPMDTPSEVITITGNDGEPIYVIIMVTGREMRDLSSSELQSRKEELLQDFVATGQLGNVEISELWRSRVPTSPLLDPKFRQPPTPTPPAVLPEVAPGDGTGDETTP
ncbi:MAG: SurA N-terminal domain-containing protein [Candidatus Promineifilaceae bacterium]|nr:SurA N-terminal domain-containing protein [Candidatus Promineifilaceae bacterium]